ncbi:MAG TPA: biotin/lipoyl-containing protein, partial [Candidatus Limnocylindrales bacterium]|nr:biotin/lipoyl-containing protein [Candidatus Limnocylindrales bacterium]
MRRYTVTVDGTPFTIDIEETAADRFSVRVGDDTFEAAIEAAADLPGTSITPGMPVQQDLRGLMAPSPAPPTTAAAAIDGPRATTAPGAAPAAAAVGAPTSRAATSTPDRPSGPGAPASAVPGHVVSAPMPGVILEVLVAAGAPLRRGDPLLVLEAMKMRNTIRSPR